MRKLLIAATALGLLVAIGMFSPAGRAVAQAIEATLVRSADNPARQPFQANTTGRVFGPGYFTSTVARVPAGKRLVLEYVSAWLSDWGYSEWYLEINTVQSGLSIRHMVPITQQSQINNVTNLLTGQLVRLYADPETAVVVALTRAAYSNYAADLNVALSGHLVDLP